MSPLFVSDLDKEWQKRECHLCGCVLIRFFLNEIRWYYSFKLDLVFACVIPLLNIQPRIRDDSVVLKFIDVNIDHPIFVYLTLKKKIAICDFNNEEIRQ